MTAHDTARAGLWCASVHDERWCCHDFFDTQDEAIAYAKAEGLGYVGRVVELTDEDVAEAFLRDASEADKTLSIQDEWCWHEDLLIEDRDSTARDEALKFLAGWVARHRLRVPCWHVGDIQPVPDAAPDDAGCPVNDPDCMGNAGDCHDACEAPTRREENSNGD